MRGHAGRSRSSAAIGRRSLTLIVVALGLALASAAAGVAQPQRSTAKPQWILFTARTPGHGVEHIFQITSTGTGLKQLTKGTYPSGAPTFSPDGKRVAYTQLGAGIFSMNVDGTGVRQLTGQGRDSFPVWSPDGKQIAFVRPTVAGWRIFVMSASGSGERRLRLAPVAGRPSWTRRGLVIPSEGDLAKIDPGSGRVQRFFGALIDASVGMDTTALAPDFLTATFVGPRAGDPGDTGCGEGVPCPVFALYIQDLRKLKAPKILLKDAGPASFSPNGKSVAYVARNKIVLRVLANGTSKTVATGRATPTGSSPPAWQPR